MKLGRGKREPRRVGGQAREIDWQCGKCGCRDANHFTRDGHYRRALETGWGHVEGLQVPMVECQCCGHDVVCTYTILEKYRRFWLDLDQQVLFGSGLCQSLRQMSQQWSALLGSSVGLRTINDRINQIEPLRKLCIGYLIHPFEKWITCCCKCARSDPFHPEERQFKQRKKQRTSFPVSASNDKEARQ